MSGRHAGQLIAGTRCAAGGGAAAGYHGDDARMTTNLATLSCSRERNAKARVRILRSRDGDLGTGPGIAGLSERVLSRDPEGGDYTRLLRFEPGADTSPMGVQRHDFWEEVLIVEGGLYDLTLDQTFTKGMYACRPPGMPHGPWRAPTAASRSKSGTGKSSIDRGWARAGRRTGWRAEFAGPGHCRP